MNFCINCTHADGAIPIYCQSPKRPKLDPVTGAKDPQCPCMVMRNYVHYCGREGKWFEPKAPELPEGWKWVEIGEILVEEDICHEKGTPTICAGQKCAYAHAFRRRIQPDPGEGWRLLKVGEIAELMDEFILPGITSWHSVAKSSIGYQVGEGDYIRRRITSELERCPEGHEAKLLSNEDGDGWWVECNEHCMEHWRGPFKKTEQGAREAWNAVMRAYRMVNSEPSGYDRMMRERGGGK